jgi:hypothetical protein
VKYFASVPSREKRSSCVPGTWSVGPGQPAGAHAVLQLLPSVTSSTFFAAAMAARPLLSAEPSADTELVFACRAVWNACSFVLTAVRSASILGALFCSSPTSAPRVVAPSSMSSARARMTLRGDCGILLEAID